MKNLELRQAVIDTARSMNSLGINHGTSGNVSVRIEDGMLITPSGMKYEHCGPEDIVFVDMEGIPHHETNRPSTEWRFHLDIYRQRPESGAVLHAHSTWCTTLACLGREIPAFHYMVAVAGGTNIRVAPYATFGTRELSDHALHALRHRKACLLANHGLLCLERNLEKVLDLAVEVENLAGVYCQTLAIGTPQVIDTQEMERVLTRFADYGSQRSETSSPL